MAFLMKGRFKAKNIKKYKGDYNEIIYRSSWELKCMMNFDKDPDVLEWSSETIIIPYVSPIDNKVHRYFVDFYVKRKTPNGTETSLIEVKPLRETKEPVRKKKINKTYINEVMTWGVNQAKWEAASKFCKERNWKFVILTEKELKITW